MQGSRARVDIRKVALFLGITFSVDWSIAGLFVLFGGGMSTLFAARWFLAVAVVYMFVPMAAALFVQGRIYRQPIAQPLGISFRPNRWWLLAWLLFVPVAFATFGVSLLFPAVHYSPDMAGMFARYADLLTPQQLAEMRAQVSQIPLALIWLMLVQSLFAGATINATAGLGEELGWRGLLLRKLAPLGFWRSSLLIGLIWGIWHAPLILLGHNYPQHPRLGVLMMTAWTLLLSPMFSYIRLRAKSVIAAAMMHGTLNATYGLAIVYVAGGSDLVVGVTGAAGFAVLAVTNLCLVVYDRFLACEPLMTGVLNP